jgi:RND family efflux transporter MFP subunit
LFYLEVRVMVALCRWAVVLAGAVAILLAGSSIWVASDILYAENTEPPPDGISSQSSPDRAGKDPYVTIDAVVVNPYRSANVGSLVGGEIQNFAFDEGDFVNKGDVVVVIDPRRYRLIALRSEQRLRAAEASLKLAEQEAKLKEELIELDAATRQDLLKKKAEAEIARFAVAEAERELDLARYDLVNCKIEAPFSGYLAVRYKQPDEPVDRLEKVFALVDSSKVYAVANVPEILVSEFKKGTEAEFVQGTDRKFTGVVEKIGKLIDPKSRTKRVYLLIDNSDSKLEIGMTGSLKLVK